MSRAAAMLRSVVTAPTVAPGEKEKEKEQANPQPGPEPEPEPEPVVYAETHAGQFIEYVPGVFPLQPAALVSRCF